MEANYLFLISIVYFFGSIPFAYILPKIFGLGDIRNLGSGNVGATNVLRAGNKLLAIIVLAFDIIKGFAPLFILKNYYHNELSEIIILFIGSAAILGHIFPIWLKFKGGKGVATYIGFLFAINYIFGIIFIITWLLIAFLKKYSSLASITSLVLLPLFVMLFSYEKQIIYLLILINLIIISKHYSNIYRLINKSETKIKF
ncbi:MAG: glycerol-3-phosphate 1-O-acyltransferase PlsY [Alphaproteobacteria bacterium]|jgi:glycerol-3-phosphate acyltransferase PlsY|nr:glycerol-3-phosphate 1-O-acyltransferase PlsY [Alphaproteobacteria bacterium]|tara:strand:- start:104 stop:703 length:600 start_codon:yes stop_codon:yes gene_type:complete